VDETVWHSRHEYANLGEDRGEGAAMDATMDEARVILRARGTILRAKPTPLTWKITAT